MGYEFRLGKLLLPVSPSSFQYSIKGNNKKRISDYKKSKTIGAKL